MFFDGGCDVFRERHFGSLRGYEGAIDFDCEREVSFERFSIRWFDCMTNMETIPM